MNRIIVNAVAFAILTGAAASTFAQTRPGTATPTTVKPAVPQATPAQTPANVPAAKIALINTSVFGDEKEGIRRYVNAVKSVQGEFTAKTAELNGLQARIKALADEITKLSAAPVVSQDTITAKQSEGERLQRELKYKKEQAESDMDRRYSAVVSPVSADIGKALDQYASQHGITLVLDISKLLPAILTANPATDITPSFIADYNSTHP